MFRAHRPWLRWLCALTLATVTLAPARGARADPASDEASAEQRRSDAKAKYQQGAAAYAAGHYKDAVDFFLAADHLAPSAPLSFNIARAYERLGDDAGALRWYRDYLRRNPAASNGDAVRSLIATLSQALRKKGLQQLSVFSSPAGATVTVDDQPVGVTPWTGELGPGKHHLLLSQRGYIDVERDLDLAPDEPQDLSLRLEQTAPLAPAPNVVPAPASAALPAAPGQPRTGKRLGIWPWLTLGTGAVALGGALTFEFLRQSAERDAKHEVTQLGYRDKLQTEQDRQTAARIFLGVSSAFLVTGGLMLLFDRNAPTHAANAGFVCLPDACGVAARGRF